MKLSRLLEALPETLAARVSPSQDPVIRGIEYDSRKVTSGELFVALRGAEADGHAFIPGALEHGAAAVVVESEPAEIDWGDCARVLVPNSRRALAHLATAYYGHPARELKLVGITGTNGKTSTSYLIDSILRAAGIRTGVIGTVEIRYGAERIPALNTTPESLDLQHTLRAMLTHGVEAVSMEVSSHGLEVGRVEGCQFVVAGITNLTQDHLDFHENMDAYRDAKALLFERHIAPGGSAVINLDDDASSVFIDRARKAGARILTVSRRSDTGADIRLAQSRVSLDGSCAQLQMPDGAVLALDLPLVGDFNLENMLLAVGLAHALGIANAAIVQGIAECPQVPGRVERVGAELPNSPTVIVDYAHTPDAVDKVLRAMRPLARARLITVFGCGGDRDRGKRPLMAQAVTRYSDRVIATSDNPRTEDPLAILRDVEAGLGTLERVAAEALDRTGAAYTVIPDRRAAIALAVALAKPEDTVIVAGKGHEDYQIIGRERLPFDDRIEALAALGRRGDG